MEYIENEQPEILYDKMTVTKEMSKKSTAASQAKVIGKAGGTGVPTIGGQQHPHASSSSNRKLNNTNK